MKIKNKKRMMKMFFVVITLIIFISLVFLNNLVLMSPIGYIHDTTPTFVWHGFEEEYRLLVDKDSEFKVPVVDLVSKNNKVTLDNDLDFGKYYWKIISDNKESYTGYFVVDSVIKIELDDKLKNKGNTPVLISGGITGAVVLDINEEIELNEGEYKIEQR